MGAIAVLFSHYVGIFWIAHPEISALMGAPAISDFPKLDFPLSAIAEHCIVIGQFGVGVFFIVSGLVISYSLENSSRANFLFRRGMRIYPVYITGFSLVVLSVLALSYYTGSKFKFSFSDIAAHFGIISRGPLGVDRIDGISWTLEVELYFYLAMMAFSGWVLNFKLKGYVVTAVFIAAAAAFAMRQWGYLLATQIGSGLLLMLGIAYYSCLKKRISINSLWVIQAVISVFIVIHWMFVSGWLPYTIQWAIGYLFAMTVFYVCFAFREKIRANALLSHLSDISYPLYVVHALFGYAIMYILVDQKIQPLASILISFVSAYLAALLIHVFIEKPALSWSKSGPKTPISTLRG